MDKKKKPKRKAKWLNDDYVPLFIRIKRKYPNFILKVKLYHECVKELVPVIFRCFLIYMKAALEIVVGIVFCIKTDFSMLFKRK